MDDDDGWLDELEADPYLEAQGRHRRGGYHRKPQPPPERHPNWCGCQNCRREIAKFETGQFRSFMIIVAVCVAIYLIVHLAGMIP